MTITESELFDWSSDLRLGAGRKFDRERLTRALSEVRRLRKFRGDNLVVAEMKVESQQRELERATAKIEEQAKEIERLSRWVPQSPGEAGAPHDF